MYLNHGVDGTNSDKLRSLLNKEISTELLSVFFRLFFLAIPFSPRAVAQCMISKRKECSV